MEAGTVTGNHYPILPGSVINDRTKGEILLRSSRQPKKYFSYKFAVVANGRWPTEPGSYSYFQGGLMRKYFPNTALDIAVCIAGAIIAVAFTFFIQ